MPNVLTVNDASGPKAGDSLLGAPLPITTIVSGEFWTLLSQTTTPAGAYWTPGTSYQLQSFGTNLCLAKSGQTMNLASCGSAAAVFNVTGRPDSTLQLATGVFGNGTQCLDSSAATLFASCDSSQTSVSQGWNFSGPSGWVTSAQLDAVQIVCPNAAPGQNSSPTSPCQFQSNGVVNHVLNVNSCATDSVGNLVPSFQAPPGLPSTGANEYQYSVTSTISTTSSYSSTLAYAVQYDLGFTVGVQTGYNKQDGATGPATDGGNSGGIHLDNTTITTNFTYHNSTTGSNTTTYQLATGGSTSVIATIANVPPGDTAWFSIASTFITTTGVIKVRSGQVGGYEIPVPNYVLPAVPTSSGTPLPGNTNDVPVNLQTPSVNANNATILGNYSTSYNPQSPSNCSPATPTITSGATYAVSNAASSLALGARASNCQQPGNGLIQNQYTGLPDEKWTITDLGNGTYTLTNGCGNNLTDPNTSTIPGTQLTEAPKPAAPISGGNSHLSTVPTSGPCRAGPATCMPTHPTWRSIPQSSRIHRTRLSPRRSAASSSPGRRSNGRSPSIPARAPGRARPATSSRRASTN